MTRRNRTACWIPKATNLHSEYVILIAFPLQQWMVARTRPSATLYERCLSCFLLVSKWDDTKSRGTANSNGCNVPAPYDTQAWSTAKWQLVGESQCCQHARARARTHTHSFDWAWASKTDHLDGGTTRPMHQARISTHHRDAHLST